MAATESLNLPDLLEQAEAAYRSPAGRRVSVAIRARDRWAGHLSSFVRLSLDEPQAIRRVQESTGELRDCSRLDTLLPKLLDGALSLTEADLGTVRLLDPVSGALILVTQCGFGAELTGHLPVIGDDDPVPGRAARDCVQMVIADITTDPDCTRYREMAAAAGFRAMQSTPLADSSGRVFGIVSTHFRQPGRLSGRELRTMELYGDLAGEAVARHLSPAAPDIAVGPAGSNEDGPRSGPEDEPALPEMALAGYMSVIVRRLFEAGLSLASAQAIIGDGPGGDRVAAGIDEIDRAIRDIRAAVFGSRRPPPAPRTDPGQ